MTRAAFHLAAVAVGGAVIWIAVIVPLALLDMIIAAIFGDWRRVREVPSIVTAGFGDWRSMIAEDIENVRRSWIGDRA